MDASDDSLIKALISIGEWRPESAQHILRIAKNYGTFMLRDALALAAALDIEDGELGF